MGKTCVCAALILAKPAPELKGSDAQAMRGLLARSAKHKTWTQNIDGVMYTTAGHAGDLHPPDQHLKPLKRVAYENKEYDRKTLQWRYVTRHKLVPDSSKPSKPNPEYAKWTTPPTVTRSTDRERI